MEKAVRPEKVLCLIDDAKNICDFKKWTLVGIDRKLTVKQDKAGIAQKTTCSCCPAYQYFLSRIFLRFSSCCHSFYLFYLFQLHTFIITFIQYIYDLSIGYPSIHQFHHCLFAQRENLPGVPSRDSNSGMPYSRPAHYQLSYAAPLLSYAAPYWATLHPDYFNRFVARCRWIRCSELPTFMCV